MRARRLMITAVAAAIAVTIAGAQTPAQIDAALKAAYDKYKGLKEGANADYIPALAKVDSNIYGIALVTVDGKVYTTGDIKSEVSIQSISKVFTMARVIEDQGAMAIENNMGVDATGQVFNSIVAVEQYKGAEMNPLVNALYYPVENVMLGPELQWGKRENNADGFSVDDVRVQFSARFKFGKVWGGE